MGLESVTHITDLNVLWPLSADPKSAGDDHIRNLKVALKTDLPNITAPVTVTHTEINALAGRAADVAAIANAGVSGTGATMYVATQTPGTNSKLAASTAYVDAAAFSAALPAQTGNSGKIVTTNGTTASWSLIGGAGQFLQVNQAGTALTASVPIGAMLTLAQYSSL